MASLDWQSGRPNAKYYVVQMLARTLGSARPKALFNASNFILEEGTSKGSVPSRVRSATPCRYMR